MRSLSAFQRISVVAQRYNAVLLHNSFPARRPAEISAISVLPFCIFSLPAALWSWVYNNNNNKNNNHNNVYVAVIMTKVIARVHLVQLMNAGWAPTLRPSQPIWTVSPQKLRQLPPRFTIAICYYYSARKLIHVLPSQEKWKAELVYGQVLLTSLLWPFYSTVLTIS